MSDTSKSKDETAAVDAALDAVTSSVTAQVSELNQLTNTSTGRAAMGLDQLLAVGVEVTVEVGRTRSTFAELMKLEPGALLELDRDAHEPADILVNGKIVAHGEIVTVGDRYGVRVTTVRGE
jgi:flagellar motor switch protein FliN